MRSVPLKTEISRTSDSSPVSASWCDSVKGTFKLYLHSTPDQVVLAMISTSSTDGMENPFVTYKLSTSSTDGGENPFVVMNEIHPNVLGGLTWDAPKI